MIITKECLNAIRPKVKGKSDKYSWYIYRYLYKNLNHDIVIYKCDNKDNRNSYIIGKYSKYDNILYGFTIFSLVTNENYEYVGFYSSNNFDIFELYDEWFNQYKKIGRCRYIEHFEPWIADGEERFTYVDDSHRICNWCGKHQHKLVKKIITYEEAWDDE